MNINGGELKNIYSNNYTILSKIYYAFNCKAYSLLTLPH